MNRAIIGVDEEPDPTGHLETDVFFLGDRALDVEATQRVLDGDDVVQYGLAAQRVTEDIERPNIGPNGSVNLVETTEDRHVHTAWVAQPAAGFVAVDRSVGEFVFSIAYDQLGLDIRRAAVDIPALRDHLDAGDGPAEYWMATGTDALGTQIAYNDRVTREQASTADVGLGFEYAYEGLRLKGVVYDSGYAACWPRATDFDEVGFATWLGEEIVPFCAWPDEDEDGEQATLDDT